MMKTMVVMLFIMVSFSVSAVADRKNPAYRAALRDGAMAQVKVRVVDDDGSPVGQVGVKAVIAMHFSEYQRAGRTDTNGCFVVEGMTTGNYIELWAEKDGYYQSKRKLIFIGPEHAREVKDGKWQPYGAEERLVLRRKCRPISMVKTELVVDVPMTNQWVAFDIVKGDFLPPWGKGNFGDVEMNVEWDGLPTWKSQFCKAQVRFPNVDCGGYFERDVPESSFPYPVAAITNNVLIRQFSLVNREDGRLNSGRDFRKQQCSLTFRTRCKHDQEGRLIGAHWGNVHSLMISPGRSGHPTLLIESVFNPMINDVGLEPGN